MDQPCFGLFHTGKRQRRETTESATNGDNKNIKKSSGDAESLLVEDLNSLSVKERDYVFQEIHGVAEIPKETEEFVSQRLEALLKEVAGLPRRKRQALDRAFFLRPSYKTNVKFQLMFLRADRFEPLYAARRMALYFQTKLDFWGEEHLVTPITRDIFLDSIVKALRKKAEREANKKGRHHEHEDSKQESLAGREEELLEAAKEASEKTPFLILPQTDRAGRIVSVVEADYFEAHMEITRVWYHMMRLIEMDESVQIHGLIDVTFWTGKRSKEGEAQTSLKYLIDTMKGGASNILFALPFRFCAFHFCWCHDSSLSDDGSGNGSRLLWKHAIDFIGLQVGRQDRVRFRTHIGSNMEILYALLSFGIPISSFFSTSNNTINTFKMDTTAESDQNERQVGGRQKKVDKSVMTTASGTKKAKQSYPDWMQKLRDQRKKAEELRYPKGFRGTEVQWNSFRNEENETQILSTSTTPGSFVEYPQPYDVLLGRGRPYHSYPGNIALRKVIESYGDQYENTTERFGKLCLAMDVLKRMQEEYGSRLLQHRHDGWEIASEETGRLKIGRLFREISLQ